MNIIKNSKSKIVLSADDVSEVRAKATYEEAIDAGEDYQSAQQHAADMQGYTELEALRALSRKEVYNFFFRLCREWRNEGNS